LSVVDVEVFDTQELNCIKFGYLNLQFELFIFQAVVQVVGHNR